MSKNIAALSFDIEDWFTVRNMREVISETDWDKQEFRVNIGLDFILSELEKKNTKATFFILGWVAEKDPEIVLKIKRGGHEIGTHGYSHKPIDLMTKEEFKADLKKSLEILENISGAKVLGFRAPSFSVTKKTWWALDVIKELGLYYDSSIFTTVHPDYGVADFPRNVSEVNSLIEVPMKNASILGLSIPFCGGGYFRLLPYFMTKLSLKHVLKSESVVMYFHPWEFDSFQPKVEMSFFKKFRHYVGLGRNQNKFSKLLNDFEFTTVENLIKIEKENKRVLLFQN